MNQAARWKAFLSWWDTYKPPVGISSGMLLLLIDEKIQEIKDGKR